MCVGVLLSVNSCKESVGKDKGFDLRLGVDDGNKSEVYVLRRTKIIKMKVSQRT